MDLIKIYEISGLPTHKLLNMLKGLKLDSEKYKVINHILKRRNDRKLANFGRGAVSQLIYEHQKIEKNVICAQIGSKKEEYCTEAEMLAAFKCDYPGLSNSEKEIFNNISKGDHWNKQQTHQTSQFYTVSNFNF
jgi:Fe-S cluster biosynthesis and repair protein YggX